LVGCWIIFFEGTDRPHHSAVSHCTSSQPDDTSRNYKSPMSARLNQVVFQYFHLSG
jgi:hypothetical protein